MNRPPPSIQQMTFFSSEDGDLAGRSSQIGGGGFSFTDEIMDDIKFSVPAVPVAQPRPRAKTGPTGYPQLYEAEPEHPVHGFKATCRMAARESYSGPPIDGPLCLTALFIMPRPTTMIWKTKAMVRTPKANGKDLDNLLKALLDALNGTLWRDDKQVYRIDAQKLIAAGDEQPHVEVVLWQESGR